MILPWRNRVSENSISYISAEARRPLYVAEASSGCRVWVAAASFDRDALKSASAFWAADRPSAQASVVLAPVLGFPFMALHARGAGGLVYAQLLPDQSIVDAERAVDAEFALATVGGVCYRVEREFVSGADMGATAHVSAGGPVARALVGTAAAQRLASWARSWTLAFDGVEIGMRKDSQF